MAQVEAFALRLCGYTRRPRRCRGHLRCDLVLPVAFGTAYVIPRFSAERIVIDKLTVNDSASLSVNNDVT